MNSLNTSSGKTNRFREKIHDGTQPVRVIHHMLIHMFQQTNSDFFEELIGEVNKGKVNKELNLVFGQDSIRIDSSKLRTPRVKYPTKSIEIHETFLSFLWSCCYSIFVTYVETIDYPKFNKQVGKEVKNVSPKNIEKAKELFDYAKLLIVDFQEWDKNNLPNPEIYNNEVRDYVEQTNLFYTEAVKFIFCHEYIHLKRDHIGQLKNDVSYYLEFEKEADNEAIDEIMKGMSNSENPFSVAHKVVIEIGVVMGVLSMFFFNSSTKGGNHPNAEDRLTHILERLGVGDSHFAWGIACVGLRMWEEQFGHYFKWSLDEKSYKEQYISIIEQIKEH